MRESTVFL